MEDETVSLREAAARLGVHYMTAYRYVRIGRLPAAKDGGEWRVRAADVRLLQEPLPAPAAGTRPRMPRTAERERLVARLVAGDEGGAWALVEGLLVRGVAPGDVYEGALAPALVEVGERWARGELDVADEHRASAVALRIVGRMGPRFARRGRTRGTVVLGAAPGDHHGLPTALLGDLVRGAGYEVVDLGADTPAASFVAAMDRTTRLVAVGVCATTGDRDAAAADAVAALHAAPRPGGVPVHVVLGGRAIRSQDHARALGADSWSDEPHRFIAILEAARRTPDR